MYNETLNDFLKSVDKKLADIKRYKEASDMPNYAILVHSLKKSPFRKTVTIIIIVAYLFCNIKKKTTARRGFCAYFDLVLRARAASFISAVQLSLREGTDHSFTISSPSAVLNKTEESIILISVIFLSSSSCV